MIKCVVARSKRAMLELAVRNAPIRAAKLRIAQAIPGGWLVDYGTGDERSGWYSIYALGVALGVTLPRPPKPFHWDITYRERI